MKNKLRPIWDKKKENFSSLNFLLLNATHAIHFEDSLCLVLHTQTGNYDAGKVNVLSLCTLRAWNHTLHASNVAHLTNNVVMQVDILGAFHGFVMSLLCERENVDDDENSVNGNNWNKWPFISLSLSGACLQFIYLQLIFNYERTELRKDFRMFIVCVFIFENIIDVFSNDY